MAAFVICVCAVATPVPALAAVVTVSDPAGDGLKGRRLDITSVRLANRDHAIVITATVVRVTHGDLAVYLTARGERRRAFVGVLSKHRARGDSNRLFSAEGTVPCQGLRVTWDADTDRVQVRVPSRCLGGGNYGALRTKLIFENPDDADFAPKGAEGSWRWTPWVNRG